MNILNKNLTIHKFIVLYEIIFINNNYKFYYMKLKSITFFFLIFAVGKWWKNVITWLK